MALVLVTPPTVEPVSLPEAKAHLRIVHNLDDTRITQKKKAARLKVENFLERALLQQTWRLSLDDFPEEGDGIKLGRPRLIGIVSFTFTDLNGDEQELVEDDDFVFNADEEPCIIWPSAAGVTTGAIWPVTICSPGNVVIEYTAGYGTLATDVPEDIKDAILQTMEVLFDNPGADIPAIVQDTLMPYRVGIAEYA